MSAYKRSFTKDSKILILGGSGFLGSHLAKALKDAGHTNIVVGARNVPTTEGFVSIDVCDESSVEIIKAFDLVYNLTGQITHPMQDCLQQNSVGCANIAKAINESAAFLIHVSTVGVYGTVDRAEENSAFSPETPYSTCKAVAETILGKSIPVDRFSIIRISNLYGSGQAKGVFAYLLRMSHTNNGAHLNFNNDGSLVRYYLHVEDCAEGLAKLAGFETNDIKGVFNFVGAEKFTIVELIALFEEMMSIKFTTVFETTKPYDNAVDINADAFNRLVKPGYTRDLKSYIKELIGKKNQ